VPERFTKTKSDRQAAECAELRGAPIENARDYFDERGVPDLQKLVTIFGGYNKIPTEAWTRFDADMAAYRERMVRVTAAPAQVAQANPFKQYPNSEECCCCYQRGTFGYYNKGGELDWFCADHRQAKFFADSRRR
jgi:hypothetical protein